MAPDFKMFAELVLSEAAAAHQYYTASGMKPSCNPAMNPSVARSILSAARTAGLSIPGEAEPAMQPLRPPAPPAEVKEGQTWKRAASVKTEVNRERVQVVRLVYKFDGPAHKVVLQALNFAGQGFDAAGRRTMTIEAFRKYWVPC